mgnify:CR=1 FL=1
MGGKAGFGRPRLRTEPVPVQAVAPVGVDRAVSDFQRGDVVEKVRTLGGLDLELRCCGFHHGADAADLRPAHRDPQPAVGRTPAPRPDQEVLAPLLDQPGVEPPQLPGDLGRPAHIEGLRLHVDDVGDLGLLPVAEGLGGGAERTCGLFFSDIHLHELGARRPSDWVREVLYGLLNTRYNRGRLTILTTNFADEPDTRGGETLEARVGAPVRSRLYEMCQLVTIDAEDFRKKHRAKAFG